MRLFFFIFHSFQQHYLPHCDVAFHRRMIVDGSSVLSDFLFSLASTASLFAGVKFIFSGGDLDESTEPSKVMNLMFFDLFCRHDFRRIY